jgi:hypothetical protein
VPIDIFQKLETLPHLSDLVFDAYMARLSLHHLPLLTQIAGKIPIRHLSFAAGGALVASCLPVTGPADLETASIEWHVIDDPQHHGSSAAHLYEFIRPSLNTFTHLEIVHIDPQAPLEDAPFLDFRPLGPTCDSLRSLKYTTYSRSSKALDAIAEMFPNLVNLGIIYQGIYRGQWAVWTVRFFFIVGSIRIVFHLLCSRMNSLRPSHHSQV